VIRERGGLSPSVRFVAVRLRCRSSGLSGEHGKLDDPAARAVPERGEHDDRGDADRDAEA
jgi:hypothetical protein